MDSLNWMLYDKCIRLRMNIRAFCSVPRTQSPRNSSLSFGKHIKSHWMRKANRFAQTHENSKGKKFGPSPCLKVFCCLTSKGSDVRDNGTCRVGPRAAVSFSNGFFTVWLRERGTRPHVPGLKWQSRAKAKVVLVRKQCANRGGVSLTLKKVHENRRGSVCGNCRCDVPCCSFSEPFSKCEKRPFMWTKHQGTVAVAREKYPEEPNLSKIFHMNQTSSFHLE